MAEFPLLMREKDYGSKKSRGRLVNLIPEVNKDGTYASVKKAEGLTLFATGMEAPVRSNLLVNNGFIYLVSGSRLYRVSSDGSVTNIGAVNGSGRARLAPNSIPGDSEILILNGSGIGYVYSVALGLVTITDPDFFPSSSVTVLNERHWLVRDDTNEFFGSDVSDATAYNPLTFASAEESPDEVKAIIAKKSALFILGGKVTEYWQSIVDTTLPVRRVNGGSKEWGILAVDSLADVNDYFAFLADDRTVRMMQGTELVNISDLDFTLKVKGNGSADYPGLTQLEDAVGFFVDGPVHSTYYLTFPSEGWTWGYDVNTGLTHTRESEGLGYWRANSAVQYNNAIICGDIVEGKLWTLDPSNRTEDSAILRTKLVSEFISNDKNMTIPLIEIDMEVAKTNDPSADPKMIVYFTKDGGNTWIKKSSISLGKYGNHRARVPIRRFGRVVRNKDFGIRLEVTDPVDVQFYGARFYPEVSI
jgi:hypothetical protein